MTGKMDQVIAEIIFVIEKIMMKIKQTQYVTPMWTRAVTEAPANGLSPTEYGWYVKNSLLKPIWFEGPATPDCLLAEESTNRQNRESEDNSDNVLEADDDLERLSDGVYGVKIPILRRKKTMNDCYKTSATAYAFLTYFMSH